MGGADTVEIPAGTFRMGSADFYPEEQPVREVQLEAFAIRRAPAHDPTRWWASVLVLGRIA